MEFPDLLETERLLLRAPTKQDAPEVFTRYASDPEVTRYLSWRTHASIQHTRAYIDQLAEQRRNRIAWTWLIRRSDSNLLLGSIGFRINGGHLQFGYCLAQVAWGAGYATEAARAIVPLAFRFESIWRLQAYCDVENLASARVLEKAGLDYEGTMRRFMVLPNRGNEPLDMLCFARIRE